METLKIPGWETLTKDLEKIYDIPPEKSMSAKDYRDHLENNKIKTISETHAAAELRAFLNDGKVERFAVKTGAHKTYYYRPVVNSLQNRT